MVPLKVRKSKGGLNINDEMCNLLKKYSSIIYKHLISIGASKEDSEDIIQETFIKTYENIDILIDGNIKAWMFKVSLNRFYTMYKKSKTSISLTDELSAILQSDLVFYIHILIMGMIYMSFAMMKKTQSLKIILIMKAKRK